MATELFNARAKSDGHIVAVGLDYQCQPVTCYDSHGNAYEGYIATVRVVDGGAIGEIISTVDVRVAQKRRGEIYNGIAAVLRKLGVDIPDGWRSHEVPPGIIL